MAKMICRECSLRGCMMAPDMVRRSTCRVTGKFLFQMTKEECPGRKPFSKRSRQRRNRRLRKAANNE
ncbi:MAG: hypothetical protein IJ504_00840 [Bacteroidales bacterium]|nr:hypothetical protein [Bacteroidales bacterium]